MTLILDLVQEKWKEQKRPKKFQNEKKKLLDSTHYLIRHFLSKGNLENGTFKEKFSRTSLQSRLRPRERFTKRKEKRTILKN